MEDNKHTIPCVDEWAKGTLTPFKLAAYRYLMAENIIRVTSVVYRKSDEHTTIKYLSTIHHKMALERMKIFVRELEALKSMCESESCTA